MKQGLLTDRQKEVLRYRKQGLTQQQIADIIGTSKANVCTIEKAAYGNVEKAKDTLDFLYTLDASLLCTINGEEDLFEATKIIFTEAEKVGIKVRYDMITLINRLREWDPERFRGRFVREQFNVYINEDGDLYFG